jgi:hypothetical protein
MQTDLFNKKRLYTKLIMLSLVISLGLLLTSCFPDDSLTASDTDVVATFYKANTDFSTKVKFAMPDSVIHIDGDGIGKNENGPYDRQILTRIKLNLTQLGYTEVVNPEDADVLVTAAVTTTTWVTGGCYSWYYYWYPYPGYCYPVAYTYTTGTIIISMGEPNKDEKSEVLWYAGLNGILEDTASGLETRIDKNIDQAFNQSSYLGNGK